MSFNKDKIKMVFFDIDETIYMKDVAKISPKLEQAFELLHKNNVKIAIATGRANCSIPEDLKALLKQHKLDLIITINGQHIRHKDELIGSFAMDKKAIVTAIDFLQKSEIPYAFVANDKIAVSTRDPMLVEALTPIDANFIVDKDFYKTNDIYQMLVFYPESKDELVKNSGILTPSTNPANKDKNLADLRLVRWHENAVDLLNGANSKAAGIKFACDYFKISMDQVMAFGDGLNDVEMISEVGFGVAMGNAHDKLKQVADYVTTDVTVGGVYDALIALGYK